MIHVCERHEIPIIYNSRILFSKCCQTLPLMWPFLPNIKLIHFCLPESTSSLQTTFREYELFPLPLGTDDTLKREDKLNC